MIALIKRAQVSDNPIKDPQVELFRLYDRIKSKILSYYDELVFQNSAEVSPEILNLTP
jgi:hypothetical protein